MEDEKLLQALESAYNRGVTFEQIQGNLSDEALIIAQDFYSKKKMVPKILRSPVLRYLYQSLQEKVGRHFLLNSVLIRRRLPKEYLTLLKALKRGELLSDNLRAMYLKRRMI